MYNSELDNRPMPSDAIMRTIDERLVHAPIDVIFKLAADVERWPVHLSHYRYVYFHNDIVHMSANRPFGPLNWPTFWQSWMHVDENLPNIRFFHVGGVTTGMDVEWEFHEQSDNTLVRIVHLWNGPKWGWPVISKLAATQIIGPVFVHGIASRTLAGLARVAEQT
jgi:hypothetical protein